MKNNIPEFRIIELKYGQPGTGFRFWIEWLVEKEEEIDSILNVIRKKIGLKPKAEKYEEWDIFNDPSSTSSNIGYITKEEATDVIDRYIINMRPIVHKYEIKAHLVSHKR
jgi:hypothetical protein